MNIKTEAYIPEVTKAGIRVIIPYKGYLLDCGFQAANKGGRTDLRVLECDDKDCITAELSSEVPLTVTGENLAALFEAIDKRVLDEAAAKLANPLAMANRFGL
jgi:hypothetical protein